ncbi:MAG: ShlB/FhaC/HecB family hemolysin secretion/activation protein, partial [Cyanobacteria bacterium P01_D01_bin.1]
MSSSRCLLFALSSIGTLTTVYVGPAIADGPPNASADEAATAFSALALALDQPSPEHSSLAFSVESGFTESTVDIQLAQVNLPSSIPPTTAPSELLSPGDVTPELQPAEELPTEALPPKLPSVEELLGEPDGANTPAGILDNSEETFVVSQIQLAGSSIFTDADFAELFSQYTGVPITFNDLIQVRSAVTQRYVEAGFITSGAFIPPQTLEEGVVTVQVLEGSVEEIEVVGTNRLKPAYVRNRLDLVAQPPINASELLAGLQKLQIDPLIDTVSADLQAGVQPGTSVLRVEVNEADSFDLTATLDNSRSPNVGSIERRIDLQEGNLFGIGDRILLSYTNTNGSNGIDASYSIPVSPRNTRVNFEAGYGGSRVIEDTFDVLDISANAFYYEVGVTHPIVESPTQEIGLGLTFSHTQNQTRLGIDNVGAFPLSPGADEDGRSKVSALRFSQNWTQRDQKQVIAARSQFNLGLNVLGAASNNEEGIPDSQFFSWRGQGQWVRLLGEDALFFLKSDVQLASDHLFSSEQFGLGGQQTVRGYRQDALLRDNGALVSAEARLPIVRFSEDSIVQVAPFLDAGTAWNNFDDSDDT